MEQVEAERDEAISAADEQAGAAQQDAERAAAQLTALQEHLAEHVSAIEALRHDLDKAHAERAQAREDAAGARGEATVLREDVDRLRAELASKK